MKRNTSVLFSVASPLLMFLFTGCQNDSTPRNNNKVIQVGAILPLDGAW
jgi:hypothetical protein